MNIYFIRHAQSINNHLWDIHGSDEKRQEDPDLSDLGYLQAKLLANFLAGEDQEFSIVGDTQNRSGFFISHLYVSPMIRSVATGVEIGKQLGLSPIMELRLFEGGGIYLTNPDTGLREGLPGKGRSFFEDVYPSVVLPDELDEAGWWNRPFEPREERRPRAKQVLQALMEKHGRSEDNVCLVTHVGFFNHLMGELLGIPEGSKVWFRLDNAAVTRVMIDETETRLVYLNRLDYLPRDWIT